MSDFQVFTMILFKMGWFIVPLIVCSVFGMILEKVGR